MGAPGGAGAGRRIGFSFFQDVGNELKKVVWPTRQTTARLTAVVVAASAAIGAMLGAFDWVFTQIMQRFLVPPPPGL
jgi:preprotein translocase SecE subunit